jgi:hypothetical protein
MSADNYFTTDQNAVFLYPSFATRGGLFRICNAFFSNEFLKQICYI